MQSFPELSGNSVICPNVKSLLINSPDSGVWDGTGIEVLVGSNVTTVRLALKLPVQQESVLSVVQSTCPDVTSLATSIYPGAQTLFGSFPHLTNLKYDGDKFSDNLWENIPAAYPMLEKIKVRFNPTAGRRIPTPPSTNRTFTWPSIRCLQVGMPGDTDFCWAVLHKAMMPHLEELTIVGESWQMRDPSWRQVSSNLHSNSPNLQVLTLIGPKLPEWSWKGFGSLQHVSLICGTGDMMFGVKDGDVTAIARCLPTLETLHLPQAPMKGWMKGVEFNNTMAITGVSLVTLARNCPRLTELTLLIDAFSFNPSLFPNISPFVSLKSLALVVKTSAHNQGPFAQFIRHLSPNLDEFQAWGLVRSGLGLALAIGSRRTAVEDIVLGRH